jgi:putative transposase
MLPRLKADCQESQEPWQPCRSSQARGQVSFFECRRVLSRLNRAVARLQIFEKPADDDGFMRVLDEPWQIVPLPIFAMVVMPKQWHFVVQPTDDHQVSEFFRRLTVTHTKRWHAHYHTGGTGH